jgi:acyl carrier protein
MNIPESDINGESSPDTIQEWDSLKHMNLVLALEEEFSVKFSDQQIVEMLDISTIEKILNGLVGTSKNAR